MPERTRINQQKPLGVQTNGLVHCRQAPTGDGIVRELPLATAVSIVNLDVSNGVGILAMDW